MIREAVLVAIVSSAPFQCGSGSAPPREETAGDALWALSEDFEAKGDHASARHTLQFLVEKYPSSRHADEAKRKLEGMPDGG